MQMIKYDEKEIKKMIGLTYDDKEMSDYFPTLQ